MINSVFNLMSRCGNWHKKARIKTIAFSKKSISDMDGAATTDQTSTVFRRRSRRIGMRPVFTAFS